MNWDMWLGQTEKRKLQYGSPSLHWMRYWDYSGGEMTNWGAHGVDQIQSALGMDNRPVEFWPLTEGPQGAVAFRYANGTVVRWRLPAAGTCKAAPSSSERRDASKSRATISAPTRRT